MSLIWSKNSAFCENEVKLRSRKARSGERTTNRLHKVLIRHAEMAMNTRSAAFAEDKFLGEGSAAQRLGVVNLTCPKRRNNMVLRTSPRMFLQLIGG